MTRRSIGAGAGRFARFVPAMLALLAAPAVAQPPGNAVGPADRPPPCLAPAAITAIPDPSEAIRRNATALSDRGLCVFFDSFEEGGRAWRLLVVRNRAHPATVLWVVPHDDEGAAFDSGVAAAVRYGGTVVAVKTDGHRENAGQDPNRNFDIGTGPQCRDQRARSPEYTRRVLRWREGSAPIIGLHTNDRGFDGDRAEGKGNVSIRLGSRTLRPMPATVRPGETRRGASPDDTLIYVVSRRPPAEDAATTVLARRLNARRINVLYEVVPPGRNDCSLSNYAVIRGIGPYFNVEVVNDDATAQGELIAVLMAEIGVAPR